MRNQNILLSGLYFDFQNMATRTRNSQKALVDDNDYELMFSQSPPNKSHVDQRIEEDDNLMLFLSQSQQHEVLSCESTVNGLAASAASIKTNIAQVENIIKKNNSILAKQNDTVLKLIHEISANVNEMNERVNILEQKLCTLNNSVNKNRENVPAINRKLLKLENTVNIIKLIIRSLVGLLHKVTMKND